MLRFKLWMAFEGYYPAYNKATKKGRRNFIIKTFNQKLPPI